MQYHIKCTPNGSKIFEQNENETLFLDEFFSQLPSKDKCYIHLERMSNGTLSVYYRSYPVGKIKLQGRKFSMQIIKGLVSFENIEGNINDFIQRIPDWCKYIRLHCH